MAQGKQLPTVETPANLDRIDLEIVAALKDNPKISSQKIADQIGCSKTTVWERRQRLRGSDWAEDMRRELRSFALKYSGAIEAGLDEGDARDRASVALRVLAGLGVLVDKSERRLSWRDATPEQISEGIKKLSDDELADLIAQRESADSPGSVEG